MGTLKMGVYLNDFGLIGSQEGIERLRKEISSAQFQQKVEAWEKEQELQHVQRYKLGKKEDNIRRIESKTREREKAKAKAAEIKVFEKNDVYGEYDEDYEMGETRVEDMNDYYEH